MSKKPLKEYWYPRTPSRWRKKTMNLCPYQDGLYMRLVDHYMETKQALPDNDAALARICGVGVAEFTAHAKIIRAFFEAEDGNLFHETCEEVLTEQNGEGYARKKRASNAAKTRWKKSKQKQQDNAHSMPEALLVDATEQNITEEKIKEDKKERKKEIEGASAPPPSFELTPIPVGLKPTDFFLPDWISHIDWNDFAEMRKKQKKPMTPRAAKAIIKKLETYRSNGHDVSTILEQSIRNSWQDVYEPKVDYQSGGNKHQNQKRSNLDKTLDAVKIANAFDTAQDILDAINSGAASGWQGHDFGGELSGQPQIDHRADEAIPERISKIDEEGKYRHLDDNDE